MRLSLAVCGLQEMHLLRYLNSEDPSDGCHCVRLLNAFDFHGHTCLVMEQLHVSLIDYMREEAPDMARTRKIALQLLTAGAFLRRRGIIHGDIKVCLCAGGCTPLALMD